MGIDKDKSNIPRFTDRPVSKKDTNSVDLTNTKSNKIPEPKFISKDIKNHFSFSIGRQFDRSSFSKNSVTYDLNSFDEKKN
jgi:hypothetical protein